MNRSSGNTTDVETKKSAGFLRKMVANGKLLESTPLIGYIMPILVAILKVRAGFTEFIYDFLSHRIGAVQGPRSWTILRVVRSFRLPGRN
jgi:hypothetical protein